MMPGAIAFGNCIVFKPAELVPASPWLDSVAPAMPVVRSGRTRAVTEPFHASGELSFTLRYDGESLAKIHR